MRETFARCGIHGLPAIMTFLALVWIQGMASAEILHLTSGRVMEGRIVHVEGDVLHVESANGQEYVLSVDLINSIQPSKDTESAPELVAIIEKVQLAAAQRAKQAQAEKAQKTVELYMTEWCPYCRKMEQYLRQNRVRYHRYDIDRDREALKRYRRMGGRGVPVVRIGDDVIHGYNTDAVRKALRL